MLVPYLGCFLNSATGLYSLEVYGRFGGGYSCVGKTRQQALLMLARDARRYDCGERPIVVVAPPPMMEEAGLR